MEYSKYRYIPRVMIDGDDKTFRKFELDNILKSSPRFSTHSAINVVSVIGAQNSGKSTLLNRIFGCSFEVMNTEEGIQQTTKGLWASECNIPNLLVLDVEGSDGKERAKNDASFERQSALFALTVSDVVIFNMWARDAGRNQGGSVPLFAMIFKERVGLEEGKTVLHVVLRGYDGKIAADKLVKKMTDTMKEIWDDVNNPGGQEVFPFSRYIDVGVVLLADAEYEEKKFETEVVAYREWFAKQIANDSLGLQQHKLAAAGFSFSAHELWKQIHQNKRLHLPSHKEMVSAHLCGEMKRECLAYLDIDKEYLLMKSDVIESPSEFSSKLESIIKRLTDWFEAQTKMCNERIKDEKQNELIDEIIRITSTCAHNLVTKLRSKIHHQCMEELTSNPTTEVSEFVESFIYLYTDNCEALLPRYPALLSQHMTDYFRNELITHANQLKQDLIMHANQLKIQAEEHKKQIAIQEAEKQKKKKKSIAKKIVFFGGSMLLSATGLPFDLSDISDAIDYFK